MSEKKRLLFINTLYTPHIGGGAEIIIQEQVEGLQARGFHVSVLTTGSDKGLNVDSINGVKIYRAGLKNLYWHFTKKKINKFLRLVWHFKDRYNSSMCRYVREVIIKEKPDVVICHNLTGWSIAAWHEIANAGIPIIQVLHDFHLLCPSSNMFKSGKGCESQCFNCKVFRSNHAEYSDRISAVIGVSNYILSRFKKFGYFENAQKYVIHNAREIDYVAPKLVRKTNDLFRIGYIGTLSEIKGVEWLIKQFQTLASDINATLVIAGEGMEEYEMYLKSIVKSDSIHFIGYTSPRDFYSQVDLVVIPSIWSEPFGLVAIESCAYHTPVIASRTGGLPEIIKDGVNGLLCDSNQPNSLGEAILKLYYDSELYNQLARNSRDTVGIFLSRERMFNEYEEVIKFVLDK